MQSSLQSWQPIFRVFGSLHLAMFLLGVVIVACITGTIVESKLDTSVAQAYVYDAPWFGVWLTLLCINLMCATFTRLPWKRHHAGFVMTHFGIIVILAGAMIGRIWGTEGHITLFKGEEPQSNLTSYDQVVQVKFSDSDRIQTVTLDGNLHPPSPNRPIAFHSKSIRTAIIGYSNRLVTRTTVTPSKTDGPRAIRLVMQSSMVPNPLEYWLVMDDPQRNTASLGMATVRFVADPKVSAVKTGRNDKKSNTSLERHFAFAKMPGMNISHQLSGSPSGVQATFIFQETSNHTNSKGTLELSINGKAIKIDVEKAIGKNTPITGTPFTLSIRNYYADFRMQDKLPVSVSDQPNNPAILFEISGPPGSGSSSHSQTSNSPHDNMSDSSMDDGMGSSTLRIYASPDGKLRYESKSKKNGTSAGSITVGKDFTLGWADWRFQVTEHWEHATIQDEWTPSSGTMGETDEGSGILVELSKGEEKISHWILFGHQESLALADIHVDIGFGNRLIPLPFSVALEDFEVEHDEGTMNPAGFKSHVVFLDPKNPNPVKRHVWMNHPANFPDYPGVGLLGTAYKFSQASWNPNNLDQTTLQVLRDPGWSLKWIGSLLLCGGIATMFYLRPSKKIPVS